MKQITVDLGGKGEGFQIIVKGCDCATQDTMMLVVAYLRQLKKERSKPPIREKKPCGCKDAS